MEMTTADRIAAMSDSDKQYYVCLGLMLQIACCAYVAGHTEQAEDIASRVQRDRDHALEFGVPERWEQAIGGGVEESRR